MKGGHNKKSVRVEFVMSEPEAELVKERMAELGITNLSAYLRKMAVDGYIIHLDMGDIQEMIRLLRICSNNLNQYTRRANETGNIYAADIDDIRTRLDSLWDLCLVIRDHREKQRKALYNAVPKSKMRSHRTPL